METALTIRDLNKSFKQNLVLNGVDLTLKQGDVVYIKGANGSGKSTLLKIICGLMTADSGTIEKANEVYIGALIENPSFVESASLKENLQFLLGLRHKTPDTLARALCERFDLNFENKKPIRSYSVGMKQKAGIIQALMEDQNVILLDEPTRGLDKKSIQTYLDVMREQIAQGKTIVVASHDYEDIGFNRWLELDDGKLCELETPDNDLAR